MNAWDNLRDLFSIQERMNRLLEDVLGRGEAAEEAGAGVWSPAVDIFETGNEFIVVAEVPEIKQEDIDIRVHENTLTIEGERKMRKARMEGYHRVERAHGRFLRSFLLPRSIDHEAITATLKDGILRIVLPKKVEVLQKQIEIIEQG